MSNSPHSDAPAGARGSRRHSISAKIVFLVFLCTFSTGLAVSTIAIQASSREIRRQLDQGLPAALERSSRELTLWLSEGEAALRGLAADAGPTLAHVRSPSRDSSLEGRLDAFVAQSVHFDAAAIITEAGDWISDRGWKPPRRDDEARIQLPAELSGPHLTSAGGPPSALTAVSVGRGSSARLIGRYNRALLEALLEQERRDVHASLALFAGNGGIIASVPGPAGLPVRLSASLGRLQAEAPGAVHEYADADGGHALGARLPLPAHVETDWTLVAETPFANAFAPVRELVTRIFLINLAMSLVFIAAAYRISVRMLRPIENLSEGARKASSGNFGLAISDPGTHDEIARLTRSFNEMMGKLHESQTDLHEVNRQLKGRNEELQSANEVLNQLSITDGLTRLHNHRYFQESLTRELKRQSRNEKPLSMLLVDLDDFKALNDRLGHASGDELLVRVASIMSSTVRESDLLARYGGEEFVVLAADTDLEGGVQLAEKIRMAVEDTPHIVNESLRPVRITVSIGVAQYAGNRRGFFEAADRALYRAKDQGKNCVVASEEGAKDG